MNPGALRSLITIYEKGDEQQATGYTAKNPAVVGVCRARRYDASTREVWEAYVAKARNVVNFEIRCRSGIRVGQIVEWCEQAYEIIAVQRPDGLPRRMILKTVLKEAK